MPRGGSKPGERRGGRQKGTLNKSTAGLKAIAADYTVEAVVCENSADELRGLAVVELEHAPEPLTAAYWAWSE